MDSSAVNQVRNTNSEPPVGSTIEYTADSDKVTYSWRPYHRPPLQWISVLFGAFMLWPAIGMPILFSMNIDTYEQPPLHETLILGAMICCVGLYLLSSGLRIRARGSITLVPEKFEYDTGPSVVPLPLMLWFGPMFLLGPHMFGGAMMTPTHMFRKRYQQPINHISQFVLERVGERQRLRIDIGADRIEIGNLLREPEREWLTEQLNQWLTDQRRS